MPGRSLVAAAIHRAPAHPHGTLPGCPTTTQFPTPGHGRGNAHRCDDQGTRITAFAAGL
jgi:hypothetical protein